MDIKEQILALLRKLGPSVPNALVKEIKQDSIIVSSYLSELKREGKLIISKVKLGSSPYYYLPEHQRQLEPLSKHLGEKDLRAFNRLKAAKIIRGKVVEPLLRVSLQNITDYSIPIKINYKGESEVFYRYFLISQDDAIAMIRQKYFPAPQKEAPVVKPIVEKPKTERKSEKKDPVAVKIARKEEQKGNSNDNKEQQTLKFVEKTDDKLVNAMVKKFKELKIEVKNYSTIRKNTESDFDVIVPSPIGQMEYFCKVKFKKRVNEGDLSTAYIGGQTRNLPVLFATNGKLTKKAEEMHKKDFKNNFTVLLVED